jgi:S1-C subfamily serine protease
VALMLWGPPSTDPLVIEKVVPGKHSSLRDSPAGSVSAVYEKTAPGVVVIRSLSTEGAQTQGSGFIISKDGYIATNAHVVLVPHGPLSNNTGQAEGSLVEPSSIFVDFSDGKKDLAKLVGYDASNDLALIKVEKLPESARALKITDSDTVRVGQQVVVIGAPFGQQGSVSTGIISAKDRVVPALVGNFSIQGVLQTDAAVNRGNSGGPLLDMQGNVIGINAQIRSDNQFNEGVAFAISSHTLLDKLTKLRQGGRVTYAYIGLTTSQVTPQLATRFKLPASRGVLVQEVLDGSPAARAGILGASDKQWWYGEQIGLGGDIIVSIDGHDIDSPADLTEYIARAHVGERVTLEVISNRGSRQRKTASLASRS